MCRPNQNPAQGAAEIDKYIQDNLKSCSQQDLAQALHAAQDKHSARHSGCQPWNGWRRSITNSPLGSLLHVVQDYFPNAATEAAARAESQGLIEQFKQQCPCACR
jgi:hypothetical protein